MTKKTFLGAMTVVTAVALTGTALVASNMGFKLNYTIAQPVVQVPQLDTGTTTLALPDNRQTGLNDAKGLMDDIGFPAVLEIQKYVKSTNGLIAYTGRKSGPVAFPLVAGEGYRVKVQSTVNYIVVGSDDPALSYPFAQAAVQVPQLDTGTSDFAYNYHQTATDAKALMDDIGFPQVLEIQKFVKSTNGLIAYTGRKSGPLAFPLVAGEGYRIKVQSTVNYIPSHY
jgi:hypothetical protein